MTRNFTVLALLGFLGVSPRATAQPPAPRVLVMPFENVAHASRIVWLGEAAAVLLADDLNALGVDAIGRDERREAFDELQVPQTSSLTDATVIRIGELVGASQVVVGTIQLNGDVLIVRARAIALDAGRVVSDVTEGAAVSDLFAMFERIAQRIKSPASAAMGQPERAHPPVAAFENYIKGLLAETPETALRYLNAALKAEPAFDRARLAIWDVYAEQGDHPKALAAVTTVRDTSDVSRRARFLAGLSQLNLERYEAAFTTFKALADATPSAPVFNNLGVIQLRRGGTPQSGMSTYYFNKAADADATEPDYCFNLGYAYWTERNFTAATYWLREAVRRDPADGDAHYVLGAVLTAAGSPTEANREKELARRLSSTYADWEKRSGAEAVPKGLERVKSGVELPRTRRTDDPMMTGGQRDQQELAQFYLDRARRLYQQENDRDALADASRAVFLSPYQPDAHLLIGRIHLRAGRAREAIDALKISLWSAETAEAHAVLAAALVDAGEPDTARSEAQRALELDPTSSDAKRILETLTQK